MFLICVIFGDYVLLLNRISHYFSDHDSYRSMIDRVYVQTDALGFCGNVEHIPFAHSDHRIVFFEFCAPSKSPLLLKDAEFCDLISNFWSRWQSLKKHFTSLKAWWDKGKEKKNYQVLPSKIKI